MSAVRMPTSRRALDVGHPSTPSCFLCQLSKNQDVMLAGMLPTRRKSTGCQPTFSKSARTKTPSYFSTRFGSRTQVILAEELATRRMPKKCIFCPNPADSAEHLFSDWILEELEDISGPINIKIGKRKNVWQHTPEVKVNCVCHQCNNGWMSNLETKNQPYMRSMMHGHSIVLEPSQQKQLARWAVLKTIVLDAADRQRHPFYTAEERESLRPPLASCLPGTTIWLGYLSSRSFHMGATDLSGSIGEVPKAYRGSVTTVVLGHLVIQVLSVHVLPMFAGFRKLRWTYKPGKWDESLLMSWPVLGSISWPPLLSFVERGQNPIAALIDRFRIGIDVG